MFNKTEQRYLKSILKAEHEKLERAINNCLKGEIVDEKHVKKLKSKLGKVIKMMNSLEV